MISRQTHDQVMTHLVDWARTWVLPGVDGPAAAAKRHEAIEELLHALNEIPGNRSYMDTVFNLLRAWQKMPKVPG